MPSFDIENSFIGVVAGIDEAGRGPLCGPVFSACVVLNKENFPKYINDSKKIPEKKRYEIYNEILEYEKSGLLNFGYASISSEIIDKINIREATKLAMKEAYINLLCKYNNLKVDIVIVDGNFVPNIDVNSKYIIKGDEKSYSIACASIISKVLRDKELLEMDLKYPIYDFKNNKGYGTKKHIDAIRKYGIIEGYHRLSFCKKFINVFV